MGKDGNTIEIEIDAAATVAAAKTAGEANAKLVKFDAALGLFRDNVGLVSKTTENVASVMGDFNTILGKFADNLTTNLADMQTSVVQKIEPHLERELENMVNRVLNKVEAKTGVSGESRSRSEAKQGAAAPAVPVTPAGQRVGVSQDTDYKKPDYRIKENIVERIIADFDEVTGKQIERIHTTRNTRVIKDDHDQYEDDEGNLVDKTSTVTTYTSEVNKANKIIAEGAKVEKDRGTAIRKEITGALIGLHVMKVVSQYSAVANAGFMMVFAALGHLLNNILLPMMPAFIIFAQVLHTVANVIQMLPMPIRQLIGALLIWKATSMLVASMPLKDIKDGFAGIKQVMDGSAAGFQKFTNLVRAFIDFMNSGQGKGAVSWIGSGVGSLVGKGKQLLGKRAGGGPVLGHGAYIVGEKGPEIFVPKTSGSIIPNHKIGRAEGGDVEGGMSLPFGGDIMGNLGAGLGVGGLAYLMTGSPLLSAGLAAGAGMLGPEGIANGIASIVSSDIGSNFIASINVMTGMLAGILAPLAPMMGILGAVVGVVTGSRAAMGGGDGGKTADTVAAVGNAQLKQTAAMSYGVQNAVGGTGRGTNKVLSMILMRLGGCLNVAPCVPGIFGSTEIITALALIPGAISLAIGDLVAKIRYTIETVGEKPVVEDVTARITYNVETVGEKPTATDIDAKIRYTLETTGIEPVATDKTAKITYNIEKIGTEPVVTDKAATIRYNIETTGAIPTTEDVTAKIRYTLETTGIEPVATDKTATIRYNIETTGAIPTTEDVTAKIRYTTEGVTLPTTFDITGKVTSIDLTKIPVELAKVELGGIIKMAEIAPELKAAKPLIDVTGRIVEGKPADAIKTKIPEIDVRGRIADAKPSDAIKTKVPEIDVSGKVRTIDVSGIDPSKTRIPVDIDPKIPEGFDWRKAFEGAKLDGLKDIGKTGGGLFLVGFALALDEFGRTGKVNWGGLLVGLGTAFVLWTGAEAALVGVATKLAGAAAGTAVAGAMSTVGLALIAAMLIPIAANLGGDIVSAIQKAVNSGGFVTSGMFDNFALRSAFELGDSFQGALDNWMKSNFNFDVNQFITDTSQGQNGWFFDLLQGGMSGGIQLLLGPTVAGVFNKFIDDIQRTLSGGIPVDVKIDVDSVTSVVQQIGEASNLGGYTGPPYSDPGVGGGQPPINDPVQIGGNDPMGPYAPPVEPPVAYDPNNPDGLPTWVDPNPPSQCPEGQYFDSSLGVCVGGYGYAVGGRPPVNVPSLVGERGPELFIPDSSPTSIGGGGGGNTINFSPTFNVTTNNPRELTDTVMKELKMELARVKM